MDTILLENTLRIIRFALYVGIPVVIFLLIWILVTLKQIKRKL